MAKVLVIETLAETQAAACTRGWHGEQTLHSAKLEFVWPAVQKLCAGNSRK